jgi:L-lactate dehydrogenase
LEKYPGWTSQIATQIFQRTKTSGAECIAKKGGAGFAVGVAIRDVIHSVILDQQRLLPVSTVQDGACYGIRDVALSVPTVVGRAGAISRVEIDLWPKEVQGMRASGAALRPTLEAVLKRIGG